MARSLPRRLGRLLGWTFVIFSVMGGTVWAANPIGLGDSGSAACNPVATSQAGPVTAALVDPPPPAPNTYAPVDVDADGCDIGIYFSSGGDGGTFTNWHVHGATYDGIFVDGPTAAPVNFIQSSVYDIGDNSAASGVTGCGPNSQNPGGFTGCQHGFGVLFKNGAHGSIDRSQVYDVQKGGIVVRGTGTHLDVTDSLVRGLGPIGFIAQNGIQFSDGAGGSAVDNVLQDWFYSPQPVVVAGLLIVATDPRLVYRNQNTYVDDEFNELVCPPAACAPA